MTDIPVRRMAHFPAQAHTNRRMLTTQGGDGVVPRMITCQAFTVRIGGDVMNTQRVCAYTIFLRHLYLQQTKMSR